MESSAGVLAAFFGAFEIALIFAAYSAIRIFIIPLGMASDKLGTVKIIRLSFVVMILTVSGFLLFFGVESLPGWIIFALIVGISSNLIGIAVNTLAASVERKTTALFSLESMYQIGVVIGPIIGGFLTLHYGIETALLTWAVLSTVGIFITPRISVPFRQKKIVKGLFSAIKERRFAFIMILVFGSFFVGLIQSMQEIVLPLFATTIGFDVAQVGLILGIGSVITIAALLFLGKRIERKSHFTMLFAFFILMLIFPLLLPMFNDFFSLIILGAVFLIGRTANLNITRSFFSEFSDKFKATAIAIGETVYFLSRAIGSTTAGISIESLGYSGTFNTMAVLTIIALIGSAVLIFRMRNS